MKRVFTSGVALTVLVGILGLPARGQVVETQRDTTITGPRGNTIQRQVTSERGPGFAERSVNINRGGATLNRQTTIQRVPGFGGGGGGPRFMPGPGYGWGPRGFVQENVFINRGGPGWAPALAVGGGLFGLGLFAGSALAPRPPVVVAPQPVYVAAPPPVIVAPPGQPVVATQPPTTGMADPVPAELNRLSSLHEHSRRDGALALGRIRDPRAVPALVDRLKNDSGKEVRMSAAWALAEIGDPSAGVALERAAMFDKRKEVRDAAHEAYSRLPREVPETANAGAPAPGVANRTAIRIDPRTGSTPPPPPPSPSDTPPPPPEPAQSPFGTNPR